MNLHSSYYNDTHIFTNVDIILTITITYHLTIHQVIILLVIFPRQTIVSHMFRSSETRFPQRISPYIVLVLNPHINQSFITKFPQRIVIIISRVIIKTWCYMYPLLCILLHLLALPSGFRLGEESAKCVCARRGNIGICL